MIAENNDIPICKEHNLRITVCTPCQLLIAAEWDLMVKKEPHVWKREVEPLGDFHYRERLADEENQGRLHAWAVACVYVDALDDVEVF